MSSKEEITKQKLIEIILGFQTPVLPSEHKQYSYILSENYPALADMIIAEMKPKKAPKLFSPPPFEEVTRFFLDNGYPADLAWRAFEGYRENDWRDSRDRPIRNWKQKMIQVWFKPENKTKTQSGTHPGQVETTGNLRPKIKW